MRMILLLGILFLYGQSAFAAAEFTGHWQGPGTFQNEQMLQSVPADFDLIINADGTRLVIDECWVAPDAWGKKTKTCYHTDLAVNEYAQIMDGENKIGDIYPGRISVYQGDSQVGELMTFDLNSNRELLFRYNYSNMDGNIMTKIARLPEAAK